MRPGAEIKIDEELVRELLVVQFPELDASSARPLAEGWDNAVWVVEERWAFRFPRRAVAVPLLERELAVLPPLAPLLPLPVPVPVHLGRASERYPWPFLGGRLLQGSEPGDVELTDETRAALAPELGRFLRALHAKSTRDQIELACTLPLDPNRRADMSVRAAWARERLDELAHIGLWHPPPEVGRMLDDAVHLPPPLEDPVLIHGDLHFRHVLVDGSTLSAVIDWGDVGLGDRSIDLLLVWSFLPPNGRRHFFQEYGWVGDDALLRARVLSIFLCATLALYAHDEGLESVLREAIGGLERAMLDA